jgi:beta-galactosidase
MKMKYPPINGKFPHVLHGGDYNPDQWKANHEIWDEDIRLMKLANCNTMTVGVFSWAALEPEEGHFEFGWLDTIMEKFRINGIYAVLATPSGAKPAWLSQKYPEVLRVNENRQKLLHGGRHNHCFTSKVYREKSQMINRKLAERYKDHPALILWHISNEYSGECHCNLCQEAFRNWLRNKYTGDIERLNHEWWTGFWSHRFTDWNQIESPSPIGECSIHGMNLDWKRFVTDQTIDFFKNEIIPLREVTPSIQITTNLMGTYPGLNYRKLASELDVVSWDNYPEWHNDREKTSETASSISFIHDIYRSFKCGKPFILMESTPSVVNWRKTCKLKRPGMHALSSLQAIAHGSDTVMYFQWRKSRGASEKFHGAVVDHCGHENTRVFRDVSSLGEILKKMDFVIGTTVSPEVAVIYDWENRWAIEDFQGLSRDKLEYEKTCERHYFPFWKNGVSTDIIGMDDDFTKYKLLIAPMLYMLKPGVAERIGRFVDNGGVLVTTYLTGMVNENDLCFTGGFPAGGLRNVTGIWSEEIDALYDADKNHIMIGENDIGIGGEYQAHTFCDLIHDEHASVIGKYRSDFYSGRPALTVNKFGNGFSYYIAARTEDGFLVDFYEGIIKKYGIRKNLDTVLPEGVTVQSRMNGETEYLFIMNFSEEKRSVDVGNGNFKDAITKTGIKGRIDLPVYGFCILEKN